MSWIVIYAAISSAGQQAIPKKKDVSKNAKSLKRDGSPSSNRTCDKEIIRIPRQFIKHYKITMHFLS